MYAYYQREAASSSANLGRLLRVVIVCVLRLIRSVDLEGVLIEVGDLQARRLTYFELQSM